MLVCDLVIFCRWWKERERICVAFYVYRSFKEEVGLRSSTLASVLWRGKCRSRRGRESVFWESALLPGIEALYFCVWIGSGDGSGSFPSFGGRRAASLRQLGAAALRGGRGCLRRKLSLVYLLVL